MNQNTPPQSNSTPYARIETPEAHRLRYYDATTGTLTEHSVEQQGEAASAHTLQESETSYACYIKSENEILTSQN